MRTAFATALLSGTLATAGCVGSGTRAATAAEVMCADLVGGQEYEIAATRAFWGDAAFMAECVPPSDPIPEALSINLLVRPDGSVGRLAITPTTRVARCIREATAARHFPRPPGACVVHIDLSFKP